ncbi:MAG: AAA family ATPase [Agathobacter sp.]|nr:AAA family ATPase [Agathobacter sp.]
MGQAKQKDCGGRVYGVSAEAEEQYLSKTIALAQRNLEREKRRVIQLNGDIEDIMQHVNSTGDKEGLFLWNNAKAQLKEAMNNISRHEKARKKPYFGRIDFCDSQGNQEESYYIGRVGIANENMEPAVIDWRTPVASVYYENAMGKGSYTVSTEGTFEIELKRKRSYEIENDRLKDFYDLDVVANDELLTKYLSKNKTEVLGEIIATIQKEQNRIIRRSPKTNMIVQGAAGSGKTTVAMHRISYILYNYESQFRPEDFYIIGSNRILLNYITSVLPELDVYGARQMTMEQLFIRLLYEDWDEHKYCVHDVDKNDARNSIKGKMQWFCELEEFCRRYEQKNIPDEPVYMDKTGVLLVGTGLIHSYLESTPLMSMQSKRLMLNEILYSKYENEILGKNISFTPEEKKEMEKKYRTYYGKDEWKGSVFELYREFLLQQKQRGFDIDTAENSFDVYDLAALAYLYKRIKEIDPVREATHVIIDEAQDFGIMAYAALNYCMRGCTYTIMGDTSQNIHFEYGLNDWEELKKLMLTGTYDKFCLLRKSYRNTVEIANFATEILRHGDFAIYPVEPIIRHGKDVKIEQRSDRVSLIKACADTIIKWQQTGYETLAVICRDDEEARQVSTELGQYVAVKDITGDTADFVSGVMVLSVAYTKGLEFDAVLIFDPSEKKYPQDNGHTKMLYVSATRALHELAVFYQGTLSSLIATHVPEKKHLEEFETDSDEEEEKGQTFTAKELLEQQKADGSREMDQRNYIGPKRIAVAAATAANNSIRTENKQEPVVPVTARINESPYQYGEQPDNRELVVKGHTRPDTSVRWVKKSKTSLAVTSRYGVLTITPVNELCVHIAFSRSAAEEKVAAGEHRVRWTAKESPSVVEVATERLIVHINKKDGSLQFLTTDKTPLLSEKPAEPRLLEDNRTWNFFAFDKNEKLKAKGILATDLMDLDKKARYISFGGKQLRKPLVLSKKGYALAIDSDQTVMFCGIPMYGPYIYTEGRAQISYYFLYGGDHAKNIELYGQL